MGDRIIIAVEGIMSQVYVHYAPDNLLQKLEEFNKDFDTRRGFDDPDYKIARLVHMLIATDNPTETTGYGVIVGEPGDAAYTLSFNKPVQIGIVKAVGDKEIVLTQASWIADTGRFHNALKEGPAKLNEVEPYTHDVILGRGALIDATEWPHGLPREQK